MHLNLTATRLLALAGALCALALVGGCGGGDESSTGNDEAEISAIVEESVAFEDPATICEENFTEKALEDNYDGKDREALLEDCRDDEPGGVTDIEVSKVVVEGDSATVQVSARGEGEEDPISFTVELLDDDGWKIDGVRQ